MNDFGRFLYALRKRKGWTQTELADKLGVTNQAVSKWENGDSFPDTGLLVPISELFGVSVDELLKGKYGDCAADSNATQEQAPTVGATADEKEVNGETPSQPAAVVKIKRRTAAEERSYPYSTELSCSAPFRFFAARHTRRTLAPRLDRFSRRHMFMRAARRDRRRRKRRRRFPFQRFRNARRPRNVFTARRRPRTLASRLGCVSRRHRSLFRTRRNRRLGEEKIKGERLLSFSVILRIPSRAIP